MITNPEILKNLYSCNEKIMRYLVFKCELPVLGYSKNKRIWYFINNDKLKKCLKEMPIMLKVLAFFNKN